MVAVALTRHLADLIVLDVMLPEMDGFALCREIRKESDIPIVSFVPLFMFAILFGLSMDYNVFLQSRIREEYVQRGASAREAAS